MCGLQGAGKTTSIAKLAHYCQNTLNKTVSLVSTDLRRPAAIEQLRVLAQKNNIQFIEPSSEDVRDIVQTALNQSEKLLSDILIIDTSGRISTDEELLIELKTIYEFAKPQENLLVLDSMMGQQALSVVEAFHQTAPLTGFILTRLDADPWIGVKSSKNKACQWGCLMKSLNNTQCLLTHHRVKNKKIFLRLCKFINSFEFY